VEQLEDPHHLQGHVKHQDCEDRPQPAGRKPVGDPDADAGHRDARPCKERQLEEVDVAKGVGRKARDAQAV